MDESEGESTPAELISILYQMQVDLKILIEALARNPALVHALPSRLLDHLFCGTICRACTMEITKRASMDSMEEGMIFNANPLVRLACAQRLQDIGESTLRGMLKNRLIS